MKKIIFFDLDQTIYNNDISAVPKQTERLILSLAKDPNVTLGLATGRSKTMLKMIDPLMHCFDYFVVINGGLVYKKDALIHETPIRQEDMQRLIEDATAKNIILGMIGAYDESITYIDDRIGYQHTGLSGFYPKVDPDLYQKALIYQLWLIGQTQEDIFTFAKSHVDFQLYPWRKGGGDFIYKHVTKGHSIQHVLKDVDYDQLIAIGDGDNDLTMIEMADIGIAMGNAHSDALKKKADLIAPHIDEDRLYDFFVENNLI